MTALGWITIGTVILVGVALIRCINVVRRTFPQSSDHGRWGRPEVTVQQAEYWPQMGSRVTRLAHASSRGQTARDRWLREVTPVAALAARVRTERDGGDPAVPEIPEQWSTAWLDHECAEIEAQFGLDVPDAPPVRERFFRRLLNRLRTDQA